MIKQELQVDPGTTPVQARARSSSEGGRSGSDANTTISGMSMSNATSPHLGGSHALVMSRPKASPEYGDILSRDVSQRFYRTYGEYERSVRISHRGQPVQRYLLTVKELLLRFVRMSLAEMFFHGTELSDGQSVEALKCHGRCWEGAEMGPSKVAPEITRIVTIGN